MKIKIPSFKEYYLTEEGEKSEPTVFPDKQDNTKEKAADAKIKTEPSIACTISLDDIFIQLHNAAAEKCDKSFVISNSAFSEDGKRLISAGHHVIAVAAKKGKISKEDAKKQLQIYVHWFSGPDLEKTVNDDTVWPLPDDDKENEEQSEEKTAKESLAYIPTFNEYLMLEAGNPGDEHPGEDPDGPDQEEVDAKNDATDAEAETDSDDSDKTSEDKNAVDEAKGYYVTYEMKIEGVKESPLKDALKSMAKGFLKGMGVEIRNWKSGSTLASGTLGDLKDSLDKVFGKIDPTNFKQRFDRNFTSKFKQSNPHTEYFDKNTLVQHTKKIIDAKQKQKMQSADYSFCVRVDHDDKSQKLINPTVIADMVTRSIQGIFKKFKNKVTKDQVVFINNYNSDKNEKKFEQSVEKEKAKLVAKDEHDMKKGKPVKSDDEEEPAKTSKSRKKLQKSSQQTHYSGIPLNEASEDPSKENKDLKPVDDVINEVRQYFKEQAEKEFKELAADVETVVGPSDAIAKRLRSESDADDESELSEIKKHENAFMLVLRNLKQPENSSQKSVESMLVNRLFESIIDNNTPNKDKIELVFKNAISKDEFLKARGKEAPKSVTIYQYDGKEMEDDGTSDDDSVEDREEGEESLGTGESLQTAIDHMSKIFEGIDGLDEIYQQLLFEKTKNKTGKFQEKYTKLKKLLKSHLEDIRKNKDKIIKDSYYDQGQQLSLAKGDEAKNNGYDDFIYAIFDDSTNAEQLIKKLDTIIGRKQFRYDIVTRFKYKPEEKPSEDPPEEEKKPPEPIPIPKEIDEFQVGFMDKDPKSSEPDDPEYITVKRGGTAKPPQKPKYETEKNKFNGWRDQKGNLDDFDDIQEPMTYTAEYAKEVELEEFIVTFQDWNPETGDFNDIDEQVVKKGNSAKDPQDKLPKHKGYKFIEWSDSLDNIESSKTIITIWGPDIKIVPKAPKDPSKPDEDLEPVGEPIEYDPKKPIKEQLPELPEKEGWEPNGWEPDPETIKDPKKDIEIIGKYTKKDDQKEVSDGKTLYFAMPDMNGLLDKDPEDEKKEPEEVETTKIKAKNTGEYDFYIVPMKGLKFDNTDDDDEKAYAGSKS